MKLLVLKLALALAINVGFAETAVPGGTKSSSVFVPPVNNPVGGVYDAPPQDAGLPYTASGKAIAHKAVKDVIALLANADYGSRYAWVFGSRVRLDDAHPLEGEPVISQGEVYIPLSFARLLSLRKFNPQPAPEYLQNKWVYRIDRPEGTLAPETRSLDVRSQQYVSLTDVAKAFDWKVSSNDRGLIFLSRSEEALQIPTGQVLDNVVTLFDTPDKLADPDIATENIPTLKAQGKWTDHVKATPAQTAQLEGPETEWPTVPLSSYNTEGLDLRLLGSKVPAPGVYPRLLFSPEDLPMLFERMKSQKLGQKTLVEWEVLFKKSWWDPTTSDGQVFTKLASDTEYKTLQWPKVDVSPGAGVVRSLFDGQKPGITNSHINYNTNCLTTMALYCLLTGNEERGRQAATALTNYYRLVEPFIDDLNAKSDSQMGTSSANANYAETAWRGMHGVVAHMDLAFALDFGGKWMNPEQKETMQRIIAKATYGRRDNVQTAPQRVRDINHMTWHLTGFLAASAIEGLPGCDPEVLEAGSESARAFCDWGIDENGQMFESNGKSGGGIQFQILTMNVLARRGLNLWAHPHWRKLLTAQVYATAPNGKNTVSSGTWGSSPFSGPAVEMIKAFDPQNRAADYLLTQLYPDLNLATFDPVAYRAQLEKSTNRLRLPGPSYPGFVFGGLYDTDWAQISRDELKLPPSFADPVYGILSASSDATSDASWLYMQVRANQYLGSGHHHADVGMYYFSSNGVNWITESPFLKAYEGKFHNEVLIDGIAQPDSLPGRGEWLGSEISSQAAFATADQTQSYTYKWTNQVILWDNVPGNDIWSLTARVKDWELSTDPLAIAAYKGTQHRKFRSWWPTYNFSNWIPVVESKWNPVQYAFRTVGLVRGTHPYGLIIDDLKKDDLEHLYQWTAMPGSGVTAVEMPNTKPGDLVLANAKDVTDGKPKAGSPLLVIRSLDGDAVSLETAKDGEKDAKGIPQSYQRVSIPRKATGVSYKILLLPWNAGAELPKTIYDAKTGEASVEWANQTDNLKFSVSEKKRSSVVVNRGTQRIGQSK